MRLTVKPLKTREPGSGMAVVDRQVLGDSQLSSGDFVRIEGPSGRSAVARVWPSDGEDAGRGFVRIDGQLRRTADVSVDDRVEVEPTTVKSAERVTLALPDQLRVTGDLGPHVREQLADQAVTAGQTIALPVGFGMLSSRTSRRVPARVVDTTPSGPVVVTDETAVEIGDQPPETIDVDRDEPGEPEMPGVTYEDVGGLDDELQQVREMIELPMDHFEAALDEVEPGGTDSTFAPSAVGRDSTAPGPG